MKAFSPESFGKIATCTGIDIEIVSAVAASVQHDIATNRDKGSGPFVQRLQAAVSRGFADRPSLRQEYPELAAGHRDMVRNAHRESRKLERELPGAVLITSEILRLFVKGWTGAPFSIAAYTMAA